MSNHSGITIKLPSTDASVLDKISTSPGNAQNRNQSTFCDQSHEMVERSENNHVTLAACANKMHMLLMRERLIA